MDVLWGIGCSLELAKWEPPGRWNPAIAMCDRVWAENYWRWLRIEKKMEEYEATRATLKVLYRRRWRQNG